jgi:hypothetical protein
VRLAPRLSGVLCVVLFAAGCQTMEAEEKKMEKEEKALEQRSAPYLNTCKSDIAKLCKSAGNDKQKQADCLKANKSKVEASCRSDIETSLKK